MKLLIINFLNLKILIAKNFGTKLGKIYPKN